MRFQNSSGLEDFCKGRALSGKRKKRGRRKYFLPRFVPVDDISSQTIHFVFRFCEIDIFFHYFAIRCSSSFGWIIRSESMYYNRHNNHIVVSLYEFILKIIYK